MKINSSKKNCSISPRYKLFHEGNAKRIRQQEHEMLLPEYSNILKKIPLGKKVNPLHLLGDPYHPNR